MKKLGKVLEVFSAKKGQSGLPRPKVEFLDLIFDYGIRDDKFAGDDLDRSLMIVGKYSYDLVKTKDVDLEYGSLGENILLDFNPHDFKIGDIFKIGDALIQITQKCTICNHLAVFDDDLPILVKDCRGLYCKILKDGNIKPNNFVEIKE